MTGDTISDRISLFAPERSRTWDDKMLSALFADVFVDELRFNTTAREWMRYTGRMWERDVGGMHAARLAKKFVDSLIPYAAKIEDASRRDYCTRQALKYGQLNQREILVRDARDVHFIRQADLDANLDLLNCLNGTLGLRTGKFRPHSPGDMLSKLTNVEYDPSARSQEFERFIDQIMCSNAEKKRYLQKILGLALTADTSLETCWILYGPTTRNGKSTLVETVSYLLGASSGYALSMPPQTLAQKQNKDTRQASGDIARLDGCRFLSASEPPKRMLFDTALLKTLLGRDTITARHLYEREFEFIPHFHLFINTNFLPCITDDSLFSSGRINVITFDRHFTPEEQDKSLKQRLQSPENLSGILNWCLEGLRLFREEGAEPPESVRAATAQYQRDSDKLGLFISDCLIASDKNTAGAAVYDHFRKWCEDAGFGVESKRSFFDDLKSRGMLANTGTVCGKTVHNVVRGFEVIS